MRMSVLASLVSAVVIGCAGVSHDAGADAEVVGAVGDASPGDVAREAAGEDARSFDVEEVPVVADAPVEAASETVDDAADGAVGDVCQPSCQERTCGPDGCGGVCGYCEYGAVCSEDGRCTCDCHGLPPAYGPASPAGASDGTTDADCHPSCEGRTCGPDGCGGVCGLCEGDSVCGDLGQCLCACPGLPTTWGSAGGASMLQTPADVATIESVCFDYSGDGKGDNGLRPFATTINGDPTLVAGNPKTLVFVFPDGTNLANEVSFALEVVLGRAVAIGSTDWKIDPLSYTDAGQAFGTFATASISGGTLAAGPEALVYPLRIGDEAPVDLPLQDVRISSVVVAQDPGVAATSGVLGGVLRSADLEVLVAALEARCVLPDPPMYCSYVSMLKSQINLMYDLDLDDDGEGDALSLCFRFELKPVEVVGYLE